MSPSAAVMTVTVPSTRLLDALELQATLCNALRCDAAALQSLQCCKEETGAAADGFLSKCGSMTVKAVVRGRDAEKLHLFVKRADAKDMVEGMDSFGREALFFQSVMPHLEKAWRHGDSSKEQRTPDLGPTAYLGTDNLVVMEDLTRLGYKALDNWLKKGMSYAAVQQALRALARFHAASLLAQRRDGVNLAAVAPGLMNEHFFTRRPGAIGRRLWDVAADVTCNVLLTRLQPRLRVPQTKQELRRLCDIARDIFATINVEKLRAEDTTGILVVGHGDAWPNNMLFKFDEQGSPVHAVLLDFQMARVAPPALDVIMYLYIATKRDFRAQHLDSLLRSYHDDLLRFTRERGLDISKDYSWEAFRESTTKMTPLGRALSIAYNQMNAGNADDMTAFFDDGEARTELLISSRSREATVARWFDNDESFRRLMQDYVEELLELPRADA